ncbi:MAG: hypothetical protein JO340_12345 [Acidobacteriaceae bacterium]|nr:hypothetical protein [Acidobacteriaceae bacterium]
MATQPDLWGNLDLEEIRTPAAILREQAALLGQKTKNLIEARVDLVPMGDRIFHIFKLVVPTLGGYVYELFRVSNTVANLYPVRVERPRQELSTEGEFVEWVGERLSSPDTRRVLSSLLAQAKA